MGGGGGGGGEEEEEQGSEFSDKSEGNRFPSTEVLENMI